jgi:hypothetical protein
MLVEKTDEKNLFQRYKTIRFLRIKSDFTCASKNLLPFELKRFFLFIAGQNAILHILSVI